MTGHLIRGCHLIEALNDSSRIVSSFREGEGGSSGPLMAFTKFLFFFPSRLYLVRHDTV